MREKVIEKRFVRAVKAAGGFCPKFVSLVIDGMPDRPVLLPGACLAFVEVKYLPATGSLQGFGTPVASVVHRQSQIAGGLWSRSPGFVHGGYGQ